MKPEPGSRLCPRAAPPRLRGFWERRLYPWSMFFARLGRCLDRLFARRRLAVAVALAIGAIMHLAATSMFSWHFIAQGSRILWSPSGLHLYARAPDLQMGPLTFVVGGFFTVLLPPFVGGAIGMLVMLAVGYLALVSSAALLADSDAGLDAPDEGRRRTWIAAALLGAGVWTEVAVHYGHLDDVLALAAGITAVRFARSGRILTAAVLVGVAIDFKPWTLPLVALLVAAPAGRRLAALSTVAVVVAAVWLPFVFADPGTLRIFHFAIPVAADSGLAVLGVHASSTPPWDRAVQLGGAAVLLAVLVWRRQWHALIAVLVAFRMLLDPATYHYYDAGLVLGTLSLDALGRRRASSASVPFTTIIAVVGVTIGGYLLPSSAEGIVRTASLVVILVIALAPALPRRRRLPHRETQGEPRVLTRI